MKCVYVGELSSVEQQDLGLTIVRGVPFEAPDEWVKNRTATDPSRWEAVIEKGQRSSSRVANPDVVSPE